MTKFKRLTSNGSKYIYSFDTLDRTGEFSIDKADGSLKLLNTKCRLSDKKLDEKALGYILYIGKEKIIESNFPETCIYATH